MSSPPPLPLSPDRAPRARLPFDGSRAAAVRGGPGSGARIRLPLFVLLALLAGLLPRPAAAQQDGGVPPDPAVAADTLTPPPASPPARTTTPGGALDQPVQFSATDSLVVVFGDDGDRGSLYGTAHVGYGEAGLDAHRVDILFDIDELRASGLPSDSGLVGRPAFQQGSEQFSGRELAFNLRTERGRVVAAQTAIQDGFIQAGVVKVTEDSTVYVADGRYTTCDCPPEETPSYSLRSNKMKVVDGEWIYTGPIQLYLFNIPTPVWLPFGFLPAQEGRRSGPLPPQYGEDERGFYLRNWGWYQAINDYMDVQVQFGLWSKGSWQVNPMYRYNRRYRYSGNLAVDYVHNQRGEKGDPDQQIFNTSSLRWSHNQTISPTATFTGSVNLSSQNYLRTISERYDDRVRSTIGSTIRYSKRFRESGRSITLGLNHRQILADGTTDLTLPSLNFTQGARKPFQRETAAPGGERWYEKITYQYGGELSNEYHFDPLDPDTLDARGDSAAAEITWYRALFSPGDFRRATGAQVPFQFTARHHLTSSATFAVSRIPIVDKVVNLNVSPSVRYTEDWFVQTDRRRYLPEERRVETESVSDFLALRQFSSSVSASTRFYGLFPVRVGPFQGLRHVVNPTLSFTYRPDFYGEAWGYTDTYVDASGNVQRYPLVRGVSRGLQQAVSFSMRNEFLTKRVRADSAQAGGTDRPVQLLDLNASTSFNFAADSLRLAPISVTARTSLFEELTINARATLSAYQLAERDDERLVEISEFLFREPGLRFARITNFSVSASTSFRSQRSGGGRSPTPTRAGFDPQPFAGDPAMRPGDPVTGTFGDLERSYVDFAIPWSLGLDFSLHYNALSPRNRTRATLNSSFDFNVTPNWKLSGRSGFDLASQEVVMTSLNITRDFECWVMSVNWVPFGPYQSYGFDLHVKSGQLRDLLRIRQPRSDPRNRF